MMHHFVATIAGRTRSTWMNMTLHTHLQRSNVISTRTRLSVVGCSYSDSALGENPFRFSRDGDAHNSGTTSAGRELTGLLQMTESGGSNAEQSYNAFVDMKKNNGYDESIVDEYGEPLPFRKGKRMKRKKQRVVDESRFWTMMQLVRQWKPKRPLLALDVGKSVIGVAVSDPGNTIASPLGVIHRTENNHAQVFNKVQKYAEMYGVQAVVVGVPATHVSSTALIIEYVDKVWRTRPDVSLPIVLQDESYSTAEVVQRLEGNKNVDHKEIVKGLNAKEKALVDRLSAATILKRALGEVDHNFEVLRDGDNWDAILEQRKKELRSHLMTSSQDSPTVEDDGDEQMEGLTIGAQQEVKNPAPQGPPARVSKLLELSKRLHELHNRQTQTDNNKL